MAMSKEERLVENPVDNKERSRKARHSVAQELHDKSPEENPNG